MVPLFCTTLLIRCLTDLCQPTFPFDNVQFFFSNSTLTPPVFSWMFLVVNELYVEMFEQSVSTSLTLGLYNAPTFITLILSNGILDGTSQLITSSYSTTFQYCLQKLIDFWAYTYTQDRFWYGNVLFCNSIFLFGTIKPKQKIRRR